MATIDRITIQQLLLKLGICGIYKGYNYLISTLEIVLEDESNFTYVSKNIFPTVAQIYHTTPSCVEHALLTLVHRCWDVRHRQRLQSITPYTLSKRPTLSEFLHILYNYLKRLEMDSDI